ncbi:SMI1/KNR4 family protein [Pseudomonas sp. NPDC089554]|uniref:SMI1/KNR4 family protein n=1 Tax=Pseudomonas sp. NPDC089554 TaxID=3390653 RepID=UPI003CFED426
MIFTECYGSASAEIIEALCERLGIFIESWIVEFWKKSDGALLNGQVLIYSVSSIEERNNTFEVEKNFKDMIAVGDDSGGRLVLISKNGKSGFLLVDSGSASLDESEQFVSLEKLLDFIEDDEGEDTGGIGDIIATGGKPSIEEVVGIKKC